MGFRMGMGASTGVWSKLLLFFEWDSDGLEAAELLELLRWSYAMELGPRRDRAVAMELCDGAGASSQ